MINWKDFTNIRIFKSIRMKPTAVIALENRDGTVSEISVAELLSVDTGLKTQAAPAAKTTSTTLTADEVIGGLLTANQGAAGAAANCRPAQTPGSVAGPETLASIPSEASCSCPSTASSGPPASCWTVRRRRWCLSDRC